VTVVRGIFYADGKCWESLCTKSQIPPASAVWSVKFALEAGTELHEEIPPASAAWSFNFPYRPSEKRLSSEKFKLHAAEAGGI
jgi:hypothetical protein